MQVLLFYHWVRQCLIFCFLMWCKIAKSGLNSDINMQAGPTRCLAFRHQTTKKRILITAFPKELS